MKAQKLSPRYELFARAMASGSNQSQAAIVAGYNTKYPSEIGRRLVEKSGVRERIWELMEETDYVSMAGKAWTEILTTPIGVFTAGSDKWCKIVNLKLKAIDQIARIGGWEMRV